MQRRTKIIAVAVVAAVLAGAGAAWLWGPVRVETARPSRGPAIEAVYATGVVEPTVMVPIAPRSGGRLVALEADEGASVRRGQVLARIEAADLDQTVQEMQAREQLARAQHERTRELVSQKFVSPAELDRTRSELQAAEAALRRAQAQRNYNQLVAPADGLVLRRDGELGQYIPAGQPVLTLACCAPLRGYKSVSWIEASEDILSLLLVRNIIMYSVVSAILLVAAFGIYNTISTIVMEKTRDIAIMKSIGFHARDLRRIFLVEGLIVGLIGSAAGVLLGIGLMALLGSVEIRPPGVADVVHLPVWWGPEQYAMAIGFAMLACVGASWLPARRAGRLQPVAILRGAT